MNTNKYGVHKTHCCKEHGCKYGDDDCPVVSGDVKQANRCEDCEKEQSSVVKESIDLRADPICGNCGKPFSEHYHENEDFCYEDTTGDIFSSEPSDDWVLGQMADRYQDLYQAIVIEWKLANGHA